MTTNKSSFEIQQVITQVLRNVNLIIHFQKNSKILNIIFLSNIFEQIVLTSHLCHQGLNRCKNQLKDRNIIFLTHKRFSGRNTRRCEFHIGHQAKIRTWIFVELKTIWSYCTLMIIKPKYMSISIQQKLSSQSFSRSTWSPSLLHFSYVL